jgi:hypothetical protein
MRQKSITEYQALLNRLGKFPTPAEVEAYLYPPDLYGKDEYREELKAIF